MLGLLCFPNFAESLVTFLGLADLAHLRVKIFQLLALRVRWDFDRAPFRNQRDLIVSVLVGRAVEYGNDLIAHGHVVISPARIEQDAIAIFRGAIRKRDDKQFAVTLK